MAQRVATLQFGIDDGQDYPQGELIVCFQIDNTDVKEGALEVFPKREFQVGKADVQKLLGLHDPVISHKHISIRCVQFDADMDWGVPPMVYVEDLSRNGAYFSSTHLDDAGYENTVMKLLGQAKGSVPFLHGDRIFLDQHAGVYVELRMETRFLHEAMPLRMEQEIERFEQSYEVTPQVIGVGGHGTVYIAYHRQTQTPLACKVVPLYGTDRSPEAKTVKGERVQTWNSQTARTRKPSAGLEEKLARLRIEHDILRDLDHPNIIAIQKAFVTKHHIYIMQELITGGDLLSFIEANSPRLSNAQSAVITLQILKAVDYLHDKGIVHRDLKPDNVLMTCWEHKARVVLADFGHSKPIGHARITRRMFSTVGTAGYTAPEVWRSNMTIPWGSGYSIAVDMWSIGTIAAVLLVGHSMFEKHDATNEVELNQARRRAAAECDLSMIDRNEGGWEHVSKRAKEFVKALVILDEKQRLTAKQALQHPWLNCKTYADELEAIYQHAIRNWKPRSTSQDIVQRIDTSDLEPSSPQIVSAYFTSPAGHASAAIPSSSHEFQDQDVSSDDPELSPLNSLAISQQGQRKRKAQSPEDSDRQSYYGQRRRLPSIELGASMQSSYDRGITMLNHQRSVEL